MHICFIFMSFLHVHIINYWKLHDLLQFQQKNNISMKSKYYSCKSNNIKSKYFNIKSNVSVLSTAELGWNPLVTRFFWDLKMKLVHRCVVTEPVASNILFQIIYNVLRNSSSNFRCVSYILDLFNMLLKKVINNSWRKSFYHVKHFIYRIGLYTERFYHNWHDILL